MPSGSGGASPRKNWSIHINSAESNRMKKDMCTHGCKNLGAGGQSLTTKF